MKVETIGINGDMKVTHDNGSWYCAPIGTPEPSNVVNGYLFADAWPNAWKRIGKGPLELLSEPGGNGNLMVTCSGFDKSKLPLPTPRRMMMLGWESHECDARAVVGDVVFTGDKTAMSVGPAPYSIYLAGTETKWKEVFPNSDLQKLVPEPTHPKLEGAVRAFRAWNLKSIDCVDSSGGLVVPQSLSGPTLYPLTRLEPWTKGWNTAVGYSPVRRFGAGGFYGLFSFSEFMSQITNQNASYFQSWLRGNVVLGTILGAGKMKFGGKGVRCSLAKPEYLILTGDIEIDAGLLTVADAYNMEVIQFGTAARLDTGLIEHGEPEGEGLNGQ